MKSRPWRAGQAPLMVGAQGFGETLGLHNGQIDAQKDRRESGEEIDRTEEKENRQKKGAARKAAAAKKPRKTAAKRVAKAAAPKAVAPKAVAPKKPAPITTAKPAAKKAPPPPRKSIVQRIEGAVTAAVDILTDAEQLHHRLDPDPARDVDPE